MAEEKVATILVVTIAAGAWWTEGETVSATGSRSLHPSRNIAWLGVHAVEASG